MTNKSLHIIMPMGGEGRRFRDVGYNTPKPLIKIKDVEIYKRAIHSITQYINKDINIKYTFIVRQEFIDNYNIFVNIKEEFIDANIVSLDYTSKGSLDTVLKAQDYIDDNDNVLILDCDLEISCKKYIDLIINHIIDNKIAKPIALSFYSHKTKYSYAECSNEHKDHIYKILKTYEKQNVSSHALAGCYFFGYGKLFKELAKQLINDFDNNLLNYNECYVSLLYNYYINLGTYIIYLYDMNLHEDKLISYGTPEELIYVLNNEYNNIWDIK